MARRRRRSRRTSSSSGLPWLLAGMLAGLAIAGAFWWLQQPAPPPDDDALQALLAPPEPPPSRKSAENRRQTPAVPPRKDAPYDFYHLLPRMEVVIPEEELASAGTRPRDAAPNAKVRYELQVGAFRTHRQADELKARLALLGFEARIVRTETERGTWHRVRLGPFAGLRELDRVRHALQKHHIDAIALKIRE